jgi:hypothetical protein
MDPKRLNIILSIAVAVLLGAVGYFVFVQPTGEEPLLVNQLANNSSNIPANAADSNSETVVDNTVKNYSNEKYGISFNYPKDWDIQESVVGQTNYNKSGFIVRVGPKDNIALFKNPKDSGGPPSYFAIDIYEPYRIKNEDSSCDGVYQSETNFKSSTISLSGYSQLKCTFASQFGTGMSAIFTPNEETFYNLHSDLYTGQNKAAVDKILASFKLRE